MINERTEEENKQTTTTQETNKQEKQESYRKIVLHSTNSETVPKEILIN